MFGSSRASVVPLCSACKTRWLEFAQRPLQQQARRAHKQAVVPGQPPDTIPVVLKKAFNGYGPEGKHVAVSVGFMRNWLYPRRIARYLRQDEIAKLAEQRVSLSREHDFTREKAAKALRRLQKTAELSRNANSKKGEPAATAQQPKVRPLTDDEAIRVIESILPAELVFHRRPVPGSFDGVRTKIFGSVSIGQIVKAAKEALHESSGGAGVTLRHGDIWLDDHIDPEQSRIQHLGEFNISIRKRKDGPTVKRMVVVKEEVDSQGSVAAEMDESVSPQVEEMTVGSGLADAGWNVANPAVDKVPKNTQSGDIAQQMVGLDAAEDVPTVSLNPPKPLQ